MNHNVAGYDFLCRVLSPFTGPAGVLHLRERIASGAIPWESVIAIANSHWVTSAFWVKLRQKKLDKLIEPDVREYLQGMHSLNLKRNNGLKRQALTVIGALNGIGIHPLLIKGASQLFQPIHGDMGSRIMTDLDIWVAEDQMPAAVDTLTAMGYSDGGKQLNHYHHWAPLFRKGDYGAVELHREVLPETIARVLNATDIYKNSENHQIRGVRYRTPTPTHALLLCMLHSQVNDRFHYEWVMGIKSLLDTVEIVAHHRGTIDWGEIQARIARNGLTTILRTFLWNAHRLFDLPLPKGVRPAVSTIVHHALSMAAIRWQTVDRLTIKMERYHSYIHRRFRGIQRFFRHAVGQFLPG